MKSLSPTKAKHKPFSNNNLDLVHFARIQTEPDYDDRKLDSKIKM